MSRENLEIVRGLLAASSGGDLQEAGEAFDRSIEWDMSGVSGWPDEQIYRGAEVAEFLVAWADSWRDWHFEVEEIRDAGDQIFAGIHEWGIGAASGASVDQHRYFAYTLQAGRVLRVRMFSERAEALEAVGLRE